jgi:hypothetical protein
VEVLQIDVAHIGNLGMRSMSGTTGQGSLRRIMTTVHKLATIACLVCASTSGTLLAAPLASADEQAFFSQVYQYVHPSVTQARLLELGYQACNVRRSGQSTDAAKSAVDRSLSAQGVVSSNAEVGSLVHVAIDTLCPEVGYP